MKSLQQLTVADVLKVYSGKTGCACGCRGNYRYNSAHVALGSKDRGYEVKAHEVNDRQVKKILHMLQEGTDGTGRGVENFGNGYALEVGEKLWMVYPVPDEA